LHIHFLLIFDFKAVLFSWCSLTDPFEGQRCPNLSALLAQLVALKCQELLRLNVDLMSICSEWFITWFAKSLPVSTVLRVWDTLFFEGFKAQKGESLRRGSGGEFLVDLWPRPGGSHICW